MSDRPAQKRWPDCRGISGQITVESVAALAWNWWPLCRGIRTPGHAVARPGAAGVRPSSGRTTWLATDVRGGMVCSSKAGALLRRITRMTGAARKGKTVLPQSGGRDTLNSQVSCVAPCIPEQGMRHEYRWCVNIPCCSAAPPNCSATWRRSTAIRHCAAA